ncbi:hypothetical protein [Trichocoleus desertorum]
MELNQYPQAIATAIQANGPFLIKNDRSLIYERGDRLIYWK